MSGQRLIMAFVLNAVLVGPAAAHPRPSASAPDCVDALVDATIVRQTPTVPPDCGPGCIVMRWPWIVELDVDHVTKGKVPSDRLTVLTVQHTGYRTDVGPRRWRLRRNSLGAFNVLTLNGSGDLPLCSEGTPPATPYIQPPTGRTLHDLAREGEEFYGEDL